MQCVSHSLPAQAWSASYSLLLEAIKGYNIDLDPLKFLKGHPNGWPTLQIRLLHELVYTARRLGDPALAVRHMKFLLHTMHEHLSDAELSDLAGGLDTLSKQCSGSVPSSPSSPNDKLSLHFFPEVSLTKMPLVRSFKVHQLPMHLKPVGRKATSAVNSPSIGPFIF
ncbi:trafficking protein particle complex subunit 9, partial [Exaiptasia diaphana]|uniref:Uncharacterized protein n=1 Tax=Exaiptasia diaphana TaxID=2652724 RepID=A0A913YDP0_EXADI